MRFWATLWDYKSARERPIHSAGWIYKSQCLAAAVWLYTKCTHRWWWWWWPASLRTRRTGKISLRCSIYSCVFCEWIGVGGLVELCHRTDLRRIRKSFIIVWRRARCVHLTTDCITHTNVARKEEKRPWSRRMLFDEGKKGVTAG